MDIKVIELDGMGGLGGLLHALMGGDMHDMPIQAFKHMALRSTDKAAKDSADMLSSAIMYPTLTEEELAQTWADERDAIAPREVLEARMAAMLAGPNADKVIWLEGDNVCFHDFREEDGVQRRPIPNCKDHGPLIRTMATRYVEKLGPYWACAVLATVEMMKPENENLSQAEKMAIVTALYAEKGLEPRSNIELNTVEFYD